MTETDVGHDALQTGAAWRIVPRDALLVAGPDALTYLQGQCSQDLTPLPVGGSTEALLLSPQGKVDAYVRITRTGDDLFLLDTDAGCGPAAQARLERFRLRTKVTIEPAAWSCLSLRGPRALDRATASGPGTDGPALVLRVDWPGWSGVDLMGPTTGSDPDLAAWIPQGAVPCGVQAWESARIEAGVPMGGREVTEATIAAEVGLVDRTVSFTKGCFTGQELVARLDARGSNVVRRLCAVVVAGDAVPPIGAAVWTADGGHEVGALSSVARSPRSGGSVALAALHRRVDPPEAVEVRWHGPDGDLAAIGEARPLPLSTHT